MKATVTFEETLTRTVILEIAPNQDAYEVARDAYRNGEIILSGNDLHLTQLMVETSATFGDWQII